MQVKMGARRPNPANERLSMIMNTLTPSSSSSPTSSSPLTSSSSPSTSLPADTTIVLIHGLGRSPRSMSLLAKRLERLTGLRARSVGYPSRRLSVADAARVVAGRAADACGGPGRPAFAVTFSLGGPVLRHAAALRSSNGDEGSGVDPPSPSPSPEWVGSVLLAPPNRGSDLARALVHSSSTPPIIKRAFRSIYGPAVLDLALPVEEIARAWPDAPRPCGVVAGTAPRSLNPASLVLASRVFSAGEGKNKRQPRTHDGTIAIDETALSPPADAFATVHAGHTFLADSAETAELVASFLLKGRFERRQGKELKKER